MVLLEESIQRLIRWQEPVQNRRAFVDIQHEAVCCGSCLSGQFLRNPTSSGNTRNPAIHLGWLNPPKGPTTNVIRNKCNISSVFKMMTDVAFRCFKYSVEMGNTQRLGGGYSSNFQVDSIRVLFFQKPACLIWQVGPPQPSCERPSILCAFGECKNVVCRLSFATNKKSSGSVGRHLSYLKTPKHYLVETKGLYWLPCVSSLGVIKS